jgi:hypothetical protein
LIGSNARNICADPIRLDLRPKLKDWVTAVALAGEAALREPERASRMMMFRLYYLGLAEYERARRFLG